MILVDRREKPNKRSNEELVGLIRRMGVQAQLDTLEYGDFAFEGLDSKGPILIGVERKRLHDMLGCIEDSRLSVHQRLGMVQMYNEPWLLLEGVWRPHDPDMILMEGNNGGQWWPSKPGGRPVAYSKLRRYLFSVARTRSFVDILYTRDIVHTAQDICELFHYYQKRDHTSHVTKQKLNIPAFVDKPTLVRRWAEEIDGVGPKKAADAARLFKTPQALANSEAIEWLCIDGIGVKSAESIVNQIQGRKNSGKPR